MNKKITRKLTRFLVLTLLVLSELGCAIHAKDSKGKILSPQNYKAESARDGSKISFMPQAIPSDLKKSVSIPGLKPGNCLKKDKDFWQGIPFKLESTGEKFVGVEGKGSFEMPLKTAVPVRELYLILAADFSEFFTVKRNAKWPMERLDEPERFMVKVLYSDGSSEEFVPWCISDRKFGLKNGINLYKCRLSKDKVPAKLIIGDFFEDSKVGICGVCLGRDEFNLQPPEPTPLPQLGLMKPLPPSRRYIGNGKDKLTINTGTFTISFDKKKGLRWASFSVNDEKNKSVQLAAKEVFDIAINGVDIPSYEWKIKSVNTAPDNNKVTLLLSYDKPGISLEATLVFTIKDAELACLMEVKNTSSAKLKTEIKMPVIKNIRMGKDLNNLWYLSSHLDGFISNKDADFSDMYGEEHPMQMDAFFNPEWRWALCIYSIDGKGKQRDYLMSKNSGGIDYSVDYWDLYLKPGGKLSTPKVRLAVIPGGWRAAYRKYKEAYRRNFSRRKSPQWFRESFAVLDYLIFVRTIPLDKRVDLLYVADECKKKIGYCDILHLYGWSHDLKYGMYGDFSNYGVVGGKERFKKEIKKARDGGIKVVPYSCPYLLSCNSKNFPDRRKYFAVKKEDGDFGGWKNKAFQECLFFREWTDYMLKTSWNLIEDLDVDGLYMDVFGCASKSRRCFNENHGHEIPLEAGPLEYVFMKELRSKHPEKVYYSEGVPQDCFLNQFDGSLYKRWKYPYQKYARKYPFNPHIDLLRFIDPGFKKFLYAINVPGRNGNWQAFKTAFFNGNGYFLAVYTFRGMDPRFEWGWDDEALSFLRKVLKILHTYKDAFSCDNPEPLIPSRYPGVFINLFKSSKYYVWTISNRNYHTVRGNLFNIGNKRFKAFKNVWNGKTIIPDKNGMIFTEIAPRGISCIVGELESRKIINGE